MKKIGEGGSAIVYTYELAGKHAALKTFRNPLSRRKTEKIVKKLVELKHENLVRFLGYSLQPSCIALEYCELNFDGEIVHNASQLLDIWNDEENFNLHNRFNIIKQATAGLEALHRSGIIHRDFKPSNLLVTGVLSNILIKVSDFDDFYGIKNTTMATQTMTSNRLVGCTLAYTAEEICLQYANAPSFSADIFSWAMTCYEIFAGVPSPWVNVLPILNDVLLVNALSEKKRPPISDLKHRYCGAEKTVDLLSKLICQCWDSEPTKRLTVQQVNILAILLFLLLTLGFLIPQ